MSASVANDRPWWQGRRGFLLTIALMVMSILVPLAVNWWLGRKAFVVEVIGASPIVDLGGDELAKGLDVSFAGRHLTRAVKFSVRLTNSGGQPIRREDFDYPITIRIPNGGVLNARVSGSNNSALAPGITVFADRVSMESVLWNSGDSVVLDILTDGGDSRIDSSARIAGISSVTLPAADASSPSGFLIGGAVAGLLLAIISVMRGKFAQWRGVVTRRGYFG